MSIMSIKTYIAVGLIIIYCSYTLHAKYVSFIEYKNGAYQIYSEFEVEASTEIVWEVLSDYDGISRFMRDLSISKLTDTKEGSHYIKQTGHFKLFKIIPKKMELLLKINEYPGEKIVFTDVSFKDFKKYNGSWRITERNGIVSIVYHLEAKQKGINLRPVAGAIFSKMAKRMIHDLRKEILKRAGAKK